MTETFQRSAIGRPLVVAAGALWILQVAACDPEQQVSLGPLELDSRVALTLPRPLEPSSLYHDLCFELPQGYDVDLAGHKVVAPDGTRGAVFVLLRDSAGGTFVFSEISLTVATRRRWLCLGSPDLVGPNNTSIRFVAGEARSSIRWHSPDVLWRSVEKI